jgi:aminopeptidase N
MRFTLGIVLALASGTLAADPRTDGPIDPGFDYHSYANTDQFRITHLEFELTVYMRAKSLDGEVDLEVKRLDPNATQLILDTKGLMVTDVRQKATDILGATSKSQQTWVTRPYRFEKPDPILGSALVIDLPPSKRKSEIIKIEYETTENSPALQWLTPEQTAGRKKAFLYTHSEAIGARSWIPLQDTPQVRATYSAIIHTDDDMHAVMSAELTKQERAGAGRVYHFDMPQAVPSYLIALAVGDLKFQATGSRTGVWAEKSVLKAAAKEFSDVEQMIGGIEKMFGAYRWNRYDVLIMPPSFPEGGMENPRMSFITPTILAGDKSLVSVVAHELAHSWSGNLVGNATWRDLWLNEGFTDYVESRIMTELYGADRAGMEQVLGVRSLKENLAELKPPDQRLAVDLRGKDPDAVFSDVPYEKGRLFLNFLDAKFGREHFDAFLRGYFDHFAFQSLTSEGFEKYLKENLLDKYPGTVTPAEVDQWIHGPGIPPNAVLPTTTMFSVVDEQRAAWLAGKLTAKNLGAGWVTQQWLHFFNELPKLAQAQMVSLDEAKHFTKNSNAVIESAWLRLAIANDYKPANARLKEYLTSVGRILLIKPLYGELMKTSEGKTRAREIFAKAKTNYHATTLAIIAPIVDEDDKDE